jgi:hypothetical protein
MLQHYRTICSCFGLSEADFSGFYYGGLYRDGCFSPVQGGKKDQQAYWLREMGVRSQETEDRIQKGRGRSRKPKIGIVD